MLTYSINSFVDEKVYFVQIGDLNGDRKNYNKNTMQRVMNQNGKANTSALLHFLSLDFDCGKSKRLGIWMLPKYDE